MYLIDLSVLAPLNVTRFCFYYRELCLYLLKRRPVTCSSNTAAAEERADVQASALLGCVQNMAVKCSFSEGESLQVPDVGVFSGTIFLF